MGRYKTEIYCFLLLWIVIKFSFFASPSKKETKNILDITIIMLKCFVMKQFPRVFLIFLFITAVFSNGFSQTDEKINPHWLKKDENALLTTIAFIEKGDFSDKALRSFGTKQREQRKLGFGMWRYKNFLHAGHFSIELVYIADENVPLKFFFRVRESAFSRIEAHLSKGVRDSFLSHFQKVQKKFDSPEMVYEYRGVFDENFSKYYAKKAKIVGKLPRISLDSLCLKSPYLEYFDYLFSDETDDAYVTFGGDAPFGQTATEALLELKDENVFLCLLQADNPEGRIYASDALLTLNNSRKTVNAINCAFEPHIKDKIEYNTIDGCLLETLLFEKVQYSGK